MNEHIATTNTITLESSTLPCATWNWLKPTRTLFEDQAAVCLSPSTLPCATWNWLKPTHTLFESEE